MSDGPVQPAGTPDAKLPLGELVRKYGVWGVFKMAARLLLFGVTVAYLIYLYDEFLQRKFGADSLWPAAGIAGLAALLKAVETVVKNKGR